MSDFAVKTYSVIVEPHPDADLLECARVGDYFCVVGKGQFQTGDTVAYIPEGSVIPDSMITEMGLKGKLAGSKKNRVKTVKLRGVLSQGLVYPMRGESIGVNVAEILGVEKYEPPIPVHMAGEVQNSVGKTLCYDIENIKLHPNVFGDGEQVYITEKVHGTWFCGGVQDGDVIVTSNWLSSNGLSFKLNDANANNLYVRNYWAYSERIKNVGERLGVSDFFVLGEIYGNGVQDLNYGMNKPTFSVFDVFVGNPIDGRFLDFREVMDVTDGLFKIVPVFYCGGYVRGFVDKYTSGNTLLTDNHIREGVVVRSAVEGYDTSIGRKMLKSVSEEYLLRKGKNITEFS